MTASIKTESEQVFERYLDGQSLAWQRVPSSPQKHPDYKVHHAGTTCIFEVKEFDDPGEKPTDGFTPCPSIQEKIHQARKQFKGYQDHCCAVVLWNSKSIYRSTHPMAVLSAAFGKYERMETGPVERLQFDPPTYQLWGPAALTPTSNTTISAILSLTNYQLNLLWLEVWRKLRERRQQGDRIITQFDLLQQLAPQFPEHARYLYTGTIRVTVFENPHARISLPRDLFVGPFDQRWRMESGCFRLGFMGSELEKLHRTGVPFIYL